MNLYPYTRKVLRDKLYELPLGAARAIGDIQLSGKIRGLVDRPEASIGQ